MSGDGQNADRIGQIAAAPAAWLEWARARTKMRPAGLGQGGARLGVKYSDAPAYAGKRRDASLGSFAQRTRAMTRAALEVSEEDILAIGAAIGAQEWGWDEWNRIGMALWAVSDGEDHGLDTFLEISSKSRKYNEETVIARWEHYASSPPTDLGYGTLMHVARMHDPAFEPPSRARFVAQPQLSGSDSPGAQSGGWQSAGGVTTSVTSNDVNGVPTAAQLLPPQSPSNPLIALNNRFAAIGDVGGKCLVLSLVPSKLDSNVLVPSFQSPKAFTDRYANQYVMINNEPKALGAYWLKWTGRRTYDGIDLAPGAPERPGILNLWRGLGVPAKPGRWPLMRNHVCEVLAGGEARSAEYVLRYAAWAVQNPGQRAEVALVFRGGRGAGKGAFGNAMVRMFGSHGLHVYSPKHLVGAFNGHLRGCVLLFADEAFWAGDKQGESVLKGMLTEPALVIEQKGVDAMAWPNCLHVIMAANADWVVPAAHDERRFAVFDAVNTRAGDFGYFRALHAELENGGLSAMLHDLLACDLQGWHPREVVATDALRQQKQLSLPPELEWLESLLQDGRLPRVHRPARMLAYTAYAADLLEDARAAIPHGRMTKMKVARVLEQWGCARERVEDGSLWRFPPLADMRAAWEKRYRAWAWPRGSAAWSGNVSGAGDC